MSDRISTLSAYLKEDPDDPFLRYALAMEWRSAGNLEDAYRELVSLLDLHPEYLPSYYMSGQIAEALNKIPEARMWYQKGIVLAGERKEKQILGELKSALSLISGEDDE